MKKASLHWLFIMLCCSAVTAVAAQKDTVHFTVSLQNPQSHIVHVIMQFNIKKQDVLYLKMPQWTPGYYQLMNYAHRVSNFAATGNEGHSLTWDKPDIHTWKVVTKKQSSITINYDVLADSPFVATSFMDTTHAYLTPAATFFYLDKQLHKNNIKTGAV